MRNKTYIDNAGEQYRNNKSLSISVPPEKILALR
jgi:hypothetical protein